MAQTNAITTIQVFHGGGVPAVSVAEEYNREANSPRQEAEALSRLFAAIGSGVRPAKLRVRTDSAAGTLASLTLAVTQANIATDEYIAILVPGRPAVKIVAVASAAVAADGEFVSETSATVTAAAMATAINAVPGLKGYVTAAGSSGNLVITAAQYGVVGNAIKVIDGTVNGVSPAGGSLAGGLDASSAVTSTITCVFASTDVDDTITIGGVVFTAKNGGAAGEGQFNLGVSSTAMADNLVAKIVAHSDLVGLVTGVADTGVITLTWHLDPRVALLAGFMATSDADGLVLTAQPASSLTLASVTATRTYALGAP